MDPSAQTIVPTTTAFLKASLLVAGFIATNTAFTSPNPTPKNQEQGRFGRKDPGSLVGHLLKMVMVPVVASFSVIEIVLFFVSQFPELAPSTFLSIIDAPATRFTNLYISLQYLLGWSMIVAGTLIRIECFRTLGRFFTFELSVKDNHKLITTGPYAIVRHPSYTGTLMVASGNLLCAFAPGSWFAAWGVGYALVGKAMAVVLALGWGFFFVSVPLRIRKEDEVFRKQFGAEWEAWARETRYKLIPYIF